VAYQYQYIPRSEDFWDGLANLEAGLPVSEPRQPPTLTGADLAHAESRQAAITDVLHAISGPFGPVNVPHCNACANRNAANWQRDNL
jgi:hypothetical protein